MLIGYNGSSTMIDSNTSVSAQQTFNPQLSPPTSPTATADAMADYHQTLVAMKPLGNLLQRSLFTSDGLFIPNSNSAPARPSPPPSCKPKGRDQSQWYTRPTGKLEGKPSGNPTKARKNANSENKRSVELENESAIKLAYAGYKVEQNPTVPGSNKKPDYKIEGHYWDCKAPNKGTPIKNIVTSDINEPVDEKGSVVQRIVINTSRLDDPKVTPQELRKAIEKYGSDKVKEVIMIRPNGKITHVWPPQSSGKSIDTCSPESKGEGGEPTPSPDPTSSPSPQPTSTSSPQPDPNLPHIPWPPHGIPGPADWKL